jgi:hypothetical protein
MKSLLKITPVFILALLVLGSGYCLLKKQSSNNLSNLVDTLDTIDATPLTKVVVDVIKADSLQNVISSLRSNVSELQRNAVNILIANKNSIKVISRNDSVTIANYKALVEDLKFNKTTIHDSIFIAVLNDTVNGGYYVISDTTSFQIDSSDFNLKIALIKGELILKSLQIDAELQVAKKDSVTKDSVMTLLTITSDNKLLPSYTYSYATKRTKSKKWFTWITTIVTAVSTYFALKKI